MGFRLQNKLSLLNYLFDPAEEFINYQADCTQNQFNQNTQLLTPQYLEMKRSEMLSRTNNNPETEKDFRRICTLYENHNSLTNLRLKEAYQEYINSYDRISSLYLLFDNQENTILNVFNTEKEIESIYELEAPKPLSSGACITLLPNGELFCYGDWNDSGIALIIDSDYKARVLPLGAPCWYSSAVYFNRSVYCFRGVIECLEYFVLSHRFDLDENRWIELASMPRFDYWNNSVVFNRNILISGRAYRKLLLYSIDIDAFSEISYDFACNAIKLLINAERLYLIECHMNGLIYESETGDVYSWKRIGNSITGNSRQVYGLYNRGKIYVIEKIENIHRLCYYKFDLADKKMFSI